MGDARLVNGIVKGASVRSPAMQFRTDDIIVTNTYIEYEVNERIACIALNRPEDANAQSFELLDALDAAWRVAAEDPEAQVIVL
jgi:1,4-dihydroxy-2-naphthoyl-CoA synthase